MNDSVIAIILNKRSIGARVIQMTAVGGVVSVILILTLEKIFDDSTLGTLIGGIASYLLSGISEFDKERKSNSSKCESKTAASQTKATVIGSHQP